MTHEFEQLILIQPKLCSIMGCQQPWNPAWTSASSDYRFCGKEHYNDWATDFAPLRMVFSEDRPSAAQDLKMKELAAESPRCICGFKLAIHGQQEGRFHCPVIDGSGKIVKYHANSLFEATVADTPPPPKLAGTAPLTTEDILQQCMAIVTRKRHDYTTAADPYENFNRSAIVAEWFTDPRDKPFAVLIATKLARLAALLSTGKEPNNESISDTFIDLATYAAIWGAARSNK